MSSKNNEFITTNADHPIESEVFRMVKLYLKKQKWPGHRIAIHLEFTATMIEPSKHKLDYETINKEIHGTVTLKFNLLFMQQDPALFIEQIVPHEIAHIMAFTKAYKAKQSIALHGDEWKSFFCELNSNIPPSVSQNADHFDDRAIVLMNNGLTAICSCEGDRKYHVISSRSSRARKMKEGNERCHDCGAQLSIIDFKETPINIKTDLAYLREELRLR